MKILLYSPVSLSFQGGVELYFEHVTTSLTKQFGDKVQIVCGDVHSQSDRYKEIHYYRLGRLLVPSCKAVRVLYTSMRWADVVYFSFGYFGQDVLLLVLKLMTKTKVVAAIHAPLFHSDAWHNRGVWFVTRFLLPHFDGVHLLSKRYQRLLQSWGVRRISVIPCGVDLKKFHFRGGQSGAPRKFRVLFVGRMTLQKGYDVVASLLSQNMGAKIRVVHDVPHTMLPSIYRSADLLLFPSREETSPAVLFEAMASGLPILSAPIPEAKEILGRLGFYTKGWEGKEWEKTIGHLQEQWKKNRIAWNHHRQELVNRAQRFSFEKLTAQLRQLLL